MTHTVQVTVKPLVHIISKYCNYDAVLSSLTFPRIPYSILHIFQYIAFHYGSLKGVHDSYIVTAFK